MKKSFLLCIAAVSLLTACSNDDVIDVSATSQHPIGFSTFIDKATRTDFDKVDDLNQFVVYGYTCLSGKDEDMTAYSTIFSKELVSKQGDNWTYDNTQYWVQGNHYQFFAFAPADAKGIKNGTFTINKAFTEDNVNNAPYQWGKITYENTGEDDLICCAAKQIATTGLDSQKVPLNFYHFLSRVGFQITNGFTNKNVKVEIIDLKIISADKYGYVYYKSESSTADASAGYCGGTSTWHVCDKDYTEYDYTTEAPKNCEYVSINFGSSGTLYSQGYMDALKSSSTDSSQASAEDGTSTGSETAAEETNTEDTTEAGTNSEETTTTDTNTEDTTEAGTTTTETETPTNVWTSGWKYIIPPYCRANNLTTLYASATIKITVYNGEGGISSVIESTPGSKVSPISLVNVDKTTGNTTGIKYVPNYQYLFTATINEDNIDLKGGHIYPINFTLESIFPYDDGTNLPDSGDPTLQ